MIKGLIKSGLKWTSLSSIIVNVAAFLKIAFLARFLDKSDFGAVAIIIVLIGFLDIILDSGLSASIIHKKKISRSEYSSLFWLNILLSFLIYSITYYFSDYIMLFYDDQRLAGLLKVMSLIILISAIGKISKTVIQKELDFKLLAIIDSISALVSLVSSIVLIYLGYKIYALVYSYIILVSVSFVSYFIFGRKYTRVYFHFDISEIISFFKVAIYNFLGQLINFLSKEIDIILIGKLLGMDQLGLYTLAKQLVMKPMNVINPILTKVFIPILSKLQSKISELTSEYSKLLNQIISINIILYTVIFIFAKYIILIFYGSNYIELVPLVRAFCLYMIFLASRNTIGSLTISSGRTDLELIWTLTCIIITPAAIIFGSSYSLLGIIFLLILTSFILVLPMWLIIIKPILKIDFKTFIFWHFPKINLIKDLNIIK